VTLFSRTLRKEEPIGSAITDECGRYRIEYDGDKARQPGRRTIDLVIRAEDPDGAFEPFESPVIYRAKAGETLAIQLQPAAVGGTEWQRLEDAMRLQLPAEDPVDLSDEDAEYAAGSSGIPLHQVLYWRAAHRLRRQNDALSAEVCYGLLRGGMPDQADRLAAMPTGEWERALDQAVRHNRIAALDDRERNEALRGLAAIGGQDSRASLAPAADDRPKDDAEERDGYRLGLARYIAVQPAVPEAKAYRLAPPSDDSPETAGGLDEMLRKERNMFPELDWAAALEEVKAKGTFHNPIRERLARFLQEAEDFDIAETVIDRYLADKGVSAAGLAADAEDAALDEAVVSRLKALQRVCQLTPRYEQIGELLGGGLDSAVSVVSMSEEAFVDQFGAPLGGAEEAREVYARAEQLHATAAQLYTSAFQAMHDVTPAALGGSAVNELLRKELPDWAALFGRIDMCDCSECRSVYSAAAYFVDLLQYLNPKVLPAGVPERPIDVLRRHRPDLEHLKLTCENTNTVIPYIDLVNEVLESYIARGVPVVNNTSPDSDAEDLNVKREYSVSFPEDISNDAASAVKRAVYPFALPYDRPLDTTRAYLELMGSSLHELMSMFPERHPAYALAGEYLGLSSTERNIWMGRLERELHEFYGYTAETIASQGLLGEYYANPNLTGSPLFARVDPQVAFDWDEGPPVPTLPRRFSVRWTGSIVPKMSRTMTIHVDGTSGGWRFWLNGQLLFDYWNTPNPPHGETAPIPMTAGRAYHVVLEYRCGGSTGEWVYLDWAAADLPVGRIPQDQLRCNLPWSGHIAHVPEFLDRTGLAYDELLELLETRYINPNPEAPNVVIAAQGDPCDLGTTWLGNLSFDNYAPLRDMHRFVRLLRKTGGSIRDLDRSLHALGRERDAFLAKLADMRKVRAELGENRVTEAELLALWSTLDTHGADSLYLKLFQNKALMNPPDPDFALLSGGKEIRGYQLPLDVKKTQLLAVLRWKENDWQAALDASGLGGNAALTLANLSRLYRYALLSRLLSVTVAEFAALQRLTGLNPFLSPTDTLRFIAARREIEENGFRIGELHYWFTSRELPNQAQKPTEVTAARLAAALNAGFKRIDESASAQEGEGATAEELKRIYVIQTLAEALDAEETVVAELIERALHAVSTESPGSYLIGDFASADPSVVSRAFAKLHKAAGIARSFGLDPDDIAYVREQHAYFDQFDWDRLAALQEPAAAESQRLFRQWRLLAQYRYARKLARSDGPELIHLFEAAKAPGATLDQVLKLMAEMTGWEERELLALCGPGGWGLQAVDFANPARIPAIHAAVRLSERLRIPASQWAAWTRELPDARLAYEVKNAAKSRHSETSWRQYAAVVENGLRERWRDALVDYVLQLPAVKANAIRNGNQLFEYFLIDVEMMTGMKTSRIKQAISSVQLFVQRCLLNLEPGVPPKAIDAKLWEWLKSYRVWEANRKIFLYPENWLEPELRDDKTPLFEELENEILQKDITDDNVRDALGNYLSQLDEIGRLDVRAMYRDGGTVHLFARTFAVPYVYYHRTRSRTGWTPWRKIDADIQGDHLVPFVFNSSLYLFWGIMEKSADQRDNRPTSQQPVSSQERFVMKLAWTEYRNNRWTGRRVSEQSLFLQWFLQTDDLEATKTNYYLLPMRLHDPEAAKSNLAFMALKDYRQIGTYGYYEARIAGRFIFNDVRKSTMIMPGFADERIRFYAPEHMDMAGMFLQAADDIPFAIPRVKNGTYYYQPVPIMGQAQGPFRLAAPYEAYYNFAFLEGKQELVYVQQDYYRTYYAEQDTGVSDPPGVRYEVLFHPLTRAFLQVYNQMGTEGLLSLATQQLTNETAFDPIFKRVYSPTSYVRGFYPTEQVGFGAQDAYGVYNWELFFHIPMLLADRLTKERRYEVALRWYHAVFNPTLDSTLPAPRKYWRFLPFHQHMEENRIWKLLTLLADPNGNPYVKRELQDQIADWRAHPFEPHRIARLRISSYQKSVVMKYIDTLVAWADDLFARDTMESINEATQLYVMAANLLGPRPEHIPELTRAAPRSYAELRQAGLDDFSNALVDVQNRFPFIKVQPAVGPSGTPIGSGVGRSLYFGIPKNDKLLRYWDTVEDRLYKIRNGLNLEGVARRLPLFEAPLDPGMAVLAAASGAGAASVLSDITQPLGHYRFAAVLPKALELCAETRTLGAALLAALEKKDGEELGSLRARHETSMYRLIRQLKTHQIEEARKQLEGLHKSRAVVEYRYTHYKNIVAAGLNAFELGQLILLGGSLTLQGIAGVAELASSIGHAAPDMNVGVAGWASSPLVAAHYGGSNVGLSAASFGKFMGTASAILGTASAMSGIMGEQKRRADEWKLQEETASRELAQIDAQIAAAEIRLSMAERDLANHDRQIEQAEETERFLRNKFTNRELYQWMANQLTTLYFQTYQLAYTTAKRAEMAYRFERGLTESGYIVFGYWDSLRKGLLAGERLYLDVKRLELAYLEQHARDYELTKSVSLLQLDPVALIALKETGMCTVSLQEELFDMDHPGHYMRRIKSVSVSIPCVVGPYTGVQGRLTLMSSRIRVSKSAAAPYKRQPDDPRFLHDFAAVQSIAFSHAQNDAGLFELSFRDERYLPFEGAGAISEWRLELPKETNAFDFDTISDIVLRIGYTAKEGGEALRQAAFASAVLEPAGTQGASGPALQLPAQPHLQRLFSARHEFSAEWHRFLHPSPADTVQTLELKLDAVRFPYRYRGRSLSINGLTCYLKLKEGTGYPGSGAPLQLSLAVPASDAVLSAPMVSSASVLVGMPIASYDVAAEGRGFGTWRLEVGEQAVAQLAAALRVTVDGRQRLHPSLIEDLIVLCDYAVV